MTVTFTYKDLINAFRQQLALFGKRAQDRKGESVFSHVTISTAEEEAVKTFINQGVDNAISEILDNIKDLDTSSTGFSFQIENPRWKTQSDESFTDAFKSTFKSYVVAYALFEFLAQVSPETTQKLAADAATRLQALRRLVFFKYPFESSNSYNDITGKKKTEEVVKREDVQRT